MSTDPDQLHDAELVPLDGPVERSKAYKWRSEIPARFKGSLDTRIAWLWNQRFGTVQSVWQDSPDLLDRTAATMFLQALLAQDLNSVTQILNRLEGGAVPDDQVYESSLRI